MLFYSYFKTLTGREVTVELKNDVAITGTLHSVDQYLNVKLNGVRVAAPEKHPQVRGRRGGWLVGRPAKKNHDLEKQTTHLPTQLAAVRNVFIRGSVVRYIVLPGDGVDAELLHDATRREARGQ